MTKLCVVAGMLVLTVSVYLSLPRAPRRQKPDTVAALAEEVALPLPSSAQLMGVRRSSGMDDRVAIKLRMKPDDVPLFLREVGVEPTAMAAGDVAYFGLDRDFCDPNAAPRFRGVQVRREKMFRTLNLGVAAPQDGWTPVYIVDHGD